MVKHTTVAEIDEADTDNAAYSATYCPADDRIRLYCGRVERTTYNFLRANKFVATPKQSCDFVAVWSPKTEDIALAMISEDDDIQDEDTSPEERAADRAERFAGYRDKRRGEAHGHADTYDAGPSGFGNQNERRAQRQATRHERHRNHALSQWSKAEYWQSRTAGVIGHALHRSSASVRRGRILTLEADQRRHATPGSRYHAHLAMRLIYENAMLENEGGTAAAVEMVPGGWIRGMRGPSSCLENIAGGWLQIQALNKSPKTGRIVSVKVWGTYGGHGYNAAERKQIVTCNIERLGENCYRSPTPEELEEFKAAKKAHKTAAPPTINPTDADAQALQDIWNATALAKYNESHNYRDTPPKVVEVRRMTQAAYSERAKSQMVFIKELTFNGVTFKTRKASSGFYDYSAPDAVVILTDKPQKPFPAGWNTHPTVTPEPEPQYDTEEASEQDDAVECDEQHITEEAVAPAGCLF